MGFSLSRPSLPLSLKPRQRLTPTSSMEATVLATTAMDWATTAMATDFTMARARLRLSPTTATTDLATTDWATGPTATAMDFTMARGRLRLSPRPLLIPTCCTVVTGPTAMATPPMATATEFTTARGRLRPRLTLTTTVDTPAMDSAPATATVLATGPTTD